MFLKVSCWPKLTSFFYTCVYRFDSSSFSKHFFAMLVTTEKTRTFVEALVFSLSGMPFSTLYLCALLADI